MSSIPFSYLSQGITKEVAAPKYGAQHKGIAPGGPMDKFSFDIGNRLLGNQVDSVALEFVLAPKLKVLRDCFFCIVGARYDQILLTFGPDAIESIDHATVYRAPKGSIIEFGGKSTVGFRTYLCFKDIAVAEIDITGKKRPPFETMFDWVDKKGVIRVVEGPEFDTLDNKEALTTAYWKITNEFSQMGFRLSTHSEYPKSSIQNMISEAVADGTIQLTPKGPIVLLRYRQTVGGYPRVYNVISADVDLLGQYAPNQIIKFKKVSLEDAREIAIKKKSVLALL